MHKAMAKPVVSEARERQILGSDLELPLITALGTVQNPSAGRVAWHSHEGCELLFVLKGATAYEFRNGPTFDLAGGHVLLVPAKTVHRGAHDVRMPASMCGIGFDLEAVDAGRNTVFTRDDLRLLAERFHGAPPAVWPFNRELRRILGRVMEECRVFNTGRHDAGRQDAATKASLRALACLAILEAARQLGTPGRGDPNELVAAAETYLRGRFDEPIRMPDLAKHLGLSRARMFEVFKQTTGLTPNDYLLRYRVQRAQEMLAASDQAITDIALAAGFSSSQYFSRVFRKYAGLTPSEYRHSAV